MKKVDDVTDWLSQTTDISKYFVWYPGLWDKESHLYINIHSWEGDSKNVHPEEMIIDRGEAEVDNHFRM